MSSHGLTYALNVCLMKNFRRNDYVTLTASINNGGCASELNWDGIPTNADRKTGECYTDLLHDDP